MELTQRQIQKALLIKKAVTDYFEVNKEKQVQAKELMSFFIKRGIYKSNNKDGLEIRSFLRLLNKKKGLHNIPQAHFEQKPKNKSWFFVNSSSH